MENHRGLVRLWLLIDQRGLGSGKGCTCPAGAARPPSVSRTDNKIIAPVSSALLFELCVNLWGRQVGYILPLI